ncbi:hypothetical protein VP01_3685g1 [Puccinia sorghi]|uniref:Uncharacterized protein n=1 Tax=Puccinia sorghi TaxID=27349 RepID=A0A0L6UV22_9BASI|nr:hypothetical protein VP01_3685g1 [Puccinia sorghi]
MTYGKPNETALDSLVHWSHLLIIIGIMLFNIFLSINFLAKHSLQRKIKELFRFKKKTMAKIMHQKLYSLEGSELSWDCDKIHVTCFCHKMALIVNSGLKKLGFGASPPPKINKAFLGSVLYSNNLKPIAEEDEEEDSVDEEGSDCDVDTDDFNEEAGDMSEEDNEDDSSPGLINKHLMTGDMSLLN